MTSISISLSIFFFLLDYFGFSHAAQYFTCPKSLVWYFLYGSYLHVIAGILMSISNCLLSGFFSVGTFLNLLVLPCDLKTWILLLGYGSACGGTITIAAIGRRQGCLPWSHYFCHLGGTSKFESPGRPLSPSCWCRCEYTYSTRSNMLLLFTVLVYSSPIC